ncbi:kinesin-like protein KIF22-A, partial [Arctopsyche grandis]|uniref:kinesin-like protein KIF22-A n=1 Tax=Arctopsyche grandis TaxID=121162 RepID=UPI00406D8D71
MILTFLFQDQEIQISFIEVYNEKVYDAIDSKEKNLRENKETFYIPDLTKIETKKLIINLVDLAGSENNKKTGNIGERMKESKNINTSLFVLNKVVNAIVNKEMRIPYRDSKLTRLLKESLSGICKCFIIATVINEVNDGGLTINTLNFASKSRKILTIEKPVFEAQKIDYIKNRSAQAKHLIVYKNQSVKG